MDVPLLDRAQASVAFYHWHVAQHEATPDDLAGLPTDLMEYYKHCFDEATAVYDRCRP